MYKPYCFPLSCYIVIITIHEPPVICKLFLGVLEIKVTQRFGAVVFCKDGRGVLHLVHKRKKNAVFVGQTVEYVVRVLTGARSVNLAKSPKKPLVTGC